MQSSIHPFSTSNCSSETRSTVVMAIRPSQVKYKTIETSFSDYKQSLKAIDQLIFKKKMNKLQVQCLLNDIASSNLIIIIVGKTQT